MGQPQDKLALGGHAYVVTDQGNAIVEATLAGDPVAAQYAYTPIVNGVRIDDIVYDGKTALGASFNGKISPLANSRVMPYGGFKRDAQQHNPKETEEVMRQSAIKYAGQQEAIKDFAGRAQKAVVSLAGEAKHQVEAALDGLKTLSKDYQEVKQPASMPASSPVVTPPATGVSSTPVQTGK